MQITILNTALQPVDSTLTGPSHQKPLSKIKNGYGEELQLPGYESFSPHQSINLQESFS